MAVQSLFYTVLMVTNSYWVTIVCIFFFGALASIKTIVSFNFLIELVGAKYRTFYGTMFCIIDSFTVVFATVYYW